MRNRSLDDMFSDHVSGNFVQPQLQTKDQYEHPNMPVSYNIEVIDNKRLIFATVKGLLDFTSFRDISEKIAAIYNKNKYNVFYDLRETILDLDVHESAEVSRTVEGKKTLAAHEVFIAGLVSEHNYAKWKFIEIVNRGMGYHTQVFLDKDEAMNWLSDNKA